MNTLALPDDGHELHTIRGGLTWVWVNTSAYRHAWPMGSDTCTSTGAGGYNWLLATAASLRMRFSLVPHSSTTSCYGRLERS